jgi:Fe-S cluster assembly iron-binding protein IscA
MVSVTDDAIEFIRRLTDGPGRSAEAGIRIAAGLFAGSLTAQVTDQPHDGDEVIDTSGARVFLDADAAHTLDGKALDASIVDGSVTFIITGQSR